MRSQKFYKSKPLKMEGQRRTQRDNSPRLNAEGSKIMVPESCRSDPQIVRFVVNMVTLATGIEADRIQSGGERQAQIARARQMAMYLNSITYQWSRCRIAQAFGRDRTTVGYACRVVEDLREDSVFDATIESLESCLDRAPRQSNYGLVRLRSTYRQSLKAMV